MFAKLGKVCTLAVDLRGGQRKKIQSIVIITHKNPYRNANTKTNTTNAREQSNRTLQSKY